VFPKYYFIKLSISALAVSFASACILAIPCQLLFIEKVTLRSTAIGIGLGYTSILPFLVLFYIPIIYFLSKRWCKAWLFIGIAVLISYIAGNIIFVSLQSPPPDSGNEVGGLSSYRFVSIYASTGFLMGLLHYCTCKWIRRG
jgi:hypothetical protein